nr:uncharacterized protein LOC121502652 [Drosophila kikkawai]
MVESVEDLSDDWMLGFQTVELESEEYRELRDVVEAEKEKRPDIKVVDGFVFKRTMSNSEPELEENRWKLWIPASLTSTLIEQAHAPLTKAHGGMAKTLHRLRQWFHWPGMVSQVRGFVRDCQVCKESKPLYGGPKPGLGTETVTYRPFQKIYIDFLGKYPRSRKGHAYIFIVVDHFSKFVFLKAMKEATTVEVVKFLTKTIFHTFGVPEIIHSDNGKQFVAKRFREMSNAAERVNQSVLNAIRAYLEEDHRDLYLPEIEAALRSSVHQATGVTPYFALFGQNMFTNGADYQLARRLQALGDNELEGLGAGERMALIRDTIRNNLHEAHENSARFFNRRTREVAFRPGQEAFRRNHVLSDFGKCFNAKFARKFLKCRIRRPIGNHMYEVEDMNGKLAGVFHVKDLKQ